MKPGFGGFGKSTWKKGDRVLAPWEPTFLYAGTIKTIGDGQALIQFDDGDSGWVHLDQLGPIALQPGQKVMSRRRMGPHFFAGTIFAVNGENVSIRFDDGGPDEHATIASLRIPCTSKGRGADQVDVRSFKAFLKYLKAGDRVWALWNNQALFPGTVSQLRAADAQIRFDDGDQATVLLDHMIPFDLPVGMFVMCRRKMGQRFEPGTVAAVNGDRVHIRYDDGATEWTTPAALALPIEGPPPAPGPAAPQPSFRPAPSTGGGGVNLNFLWILALAGVGALLYWFTR